MQGREFIAPSMPRPENPLLIKLGRSVYGIFGFDILRAILSCMQIHLRQVFGAAEKQIADNALQAAGNPYFAASSGIQQSHLATANNFNLRSAARQPLCGNSPGGRKDRLTRLDILYFGALTSIDQRNSSRFGSPTAIPVLEKPLGSGEGCKQKARCKGSQPHGMDTHAIWNTKYQIVRAASRPEGYVP
jgi:hypothetical protein